MKNMHREDSLKQAHEKLTREFARLTETEFKKKSPN